MSDHHKEDYSSLTALFVNGTLKKSPRESHTEGLMTISKGIMMREGVKVQSVRFVDHDIPYGVQPDMTELGYEVDEWPDVYKQVLDADILVVGTPVWLGEKSSVTTKFIEKLYAMSGKLNERGQYIYYGKVGGAVVTGNEDGAKHCASSILYALQHVGYSIPPQADCGWLGKIGPGPSYLDKEAMSHENDFTNKNTTFMTYNLMHLALMLKSNGGYQNKGNSVDKWRSGTKWAFENPEYR